MKNNKAKFKNQRWFQGGQFRLPMTFLERLFEGRLLLGFAFSYFAPQLLILHSKFLIYQTSSSLLIPPNLKRAQGSAG